MANVKISQLPALTSITGTDVLPIVSGNTTYNVTAANIASYVGNTAVANSIAYGVSNVIIPIADGNVEINSHTAKWTFDNDGNLTLPTNGNIDFNGGGIVQTPNQDFTVTVQDPTNDDSYAVASQVVNGNGTPYTETRLQSGGFSVATNIDTSTHTWNFDSNGILTTPGNIQGSAGNSTSFYAIDDGSAGSVELKTISFAGATLGSNVTVRQSNVTISTNDNGNTWTFDNAGVLTLPGEGVVRSNNDTLILQSYNTGTSTGNGIRIGTSGGLFFENGSNPTYLNILESANNAVMTATANLQIVADGTNTTPTWNFDTSGNLTLPGNTFQVNYANGTPVTLGGSSIAEAPFTIITNDFNATAGSRYGIDTTGGGWIATLPASPANGDAVFFADAGGAYSTNPFVVNPGLNTIMGAGGSMTVTTNGQSFGLFWNGTTWRTYN